jgi:hypothetical protein
MPQSIPSQMYPNSMPYYPQYMYPAIPPPSMYGMYPPHFMSAPMMFPQQMPGMGHQIPYGQQMLPHHLPQQTPHHLLQQASIHSNQSGLIQNQINQGNKNFSSIPSNIPNNVQSYYQNNAK